ncbi:hypothetical protein PS2_038196 [Malus domestica]
MGLVGVPEIGNGKMGMSGIPLGTKNKYKRMDSEPEVELTEEYEDGASCHHLQQIRSKKKKKPGNMSSPAPFLPFSTLFFLAMKLRTKSTNLSLQETRNSPFTKS